MIISFVLCPGVTIELNLNISNVALGLLRFVFDAISRNYYFVLQKGLGACCLLALTLIIIMFWPSRVRLQLETASLF